jgi:branched-chain amino acid transport system substrate-binding protein
LRARSLAAASTLLALLALGGAGCGGADKGPPAIGSDGRPSSLTIYSSLPLQGETRGQAEAILNGEKLALAKAGGRAGRFTVKFVSLDDTRPETGMWNPDTVSANARKAAQDQSAIAYIGEFDSSASAISLPVLNQAGILQISPGNTSIGLTRSTGADKGEPDKYYPSGTRTYGRVIPADNVQAAAQAAFQRDEGCTKLYLLNDKSVYGTGLAGMVQRDATAQGMQVLGNDAIDADRAEYRSQAAKVESAGADCVFFGGATASSAAQVWADVHAASPTAKLFGPNGVAQPAFLARLSPSAQKVTFLTTPTLPRRLYPPAAQKVLADYEAQFHKPADPYALYGYEAMSVALLAIQNAGDRGNDKQAVIDEFFGVKGRDSVLGSYSIDANGDTTLARYGGNRVAGGRLVFDRAIEAGGG